jgi:hypothetical protein
LLDKRAELVGMLEFHKAEIRKIRVKLTPWRGRWSP